MLTLSEDKLGLESTRQIEIIDLRYEKEHIAEIIDNEKVFPGYHMNKKSWITLKLDGSVEDDEIYRLIDYSYLLSKKKK